MPAGPWTMLLGYLLFGFVPVLLKLGLLGGLEASLAVSVRFVVALLIVACFWAWARWGQAGPELRLQAVNRRGLLWRGFFGGIAVLTYFYAVQLCGAGLGTLLNYTHSLWSNLFFVLFLGGRPDKWLWPLLTLAGLGLFLVIDPNSGALSAWGMGIGIVSGMAGGAAVLTIKNLRRSDNALSINLALAIGGLAVGLPLAGFKLSQGLALPPLANPWLWVALSGVFSFFGQLFFNHGFKDTSVALGSLLSLITPVLACVSGAYFLGEPLTPHFLLGSTCILTACALMSWRESLNKN